VSEAPRYYVPHSSAWPIVSSVALFLCAIGTVALIHQSSPRIEAGGWFGIAVFWVGLALLAWVLWGWFGTVVRESLHGLFSSQLDRSYRMSMFWFIVSEMMFFAAFFGALFYARLISVPGLAGAGSRLETHLLLWPEFADTWPLFLTPDGTTSGIMGAWGLPFINTVILVTSSITLTLAHWALKQDRRLALQLWLALTVALGATFLAIQIYEYVHAYRDLGLTLGSGIYGSTFFLLTGFHGAHVTIGAVMLVVMLVRSLRGHFTSRDHFAFEATSWYWHFVDVVWLFLFTFVYWF
jgi:cytochrome c oxidase subunit III